MVSLLLLLFFWGQFGGLASLLAFQVKAVHDRLHALPRFKHIGSKLMNRAGVFSVEVLHWSKEVDDNKDVEEADLEEPGHCQ